MTRDEYVQQLVSNNVPQESWSAAMADHRTHVGAFDDDPGQALPAQAPAQVPTQPTVQPSQLGNVAYSYQPGAGMPAHSADPNSPGVRLAAPIAEMASNVVNAIPRALVHPIQTLAGIGRGVVSQTASMGVPPSYVTPGAPGYVDPLAAQQFGGEIAAGAQSPQERRSVTLGQLMTPSAPFAGPSEQVAQKAAGAVAENIGKSWLEKQLGIPKTILSKAGGTPNEGLDRIINTIGDYGIETPLGINKAVNNTVDAINTQSDNADKILNKYLAATTTGVGGIPAHRNAVAMVDVDKQMLELMDQIKTDPKIQGLMTKEDQAQSIVSNIQKSLEDKGLAGPQYIDKLPEIKRTIADGMGLFKKGPYNIGDDPLAKNVGELAYFKIMNSLNDVPGLEDFAQANKNTSDLLKVKSALDDAALKSRQGRVSPGTIMKSVLESGMGAIAGAGHGAAGSVLGSIVVPAAGYVGERVAPPLLMKTGRFLQGKKTLGEVMPGLSADEENFLEQRAKIQSAQTPEDRASVYNYIQKNPDFGSYAR